MYLGEQTLAEVARTVPGATAVFHDYQLNFCCGGDQTVRQAAEARGVDVQKLVSRLEQLRMEHGPDDQQQEMDTEELIDELRSRHRHMLNEQLPELIRLARKVENVHARHPECPAGLALLLTTMEQELREHMHKEDRVFSLVADGTDQSSPASLSTLRDEHEQQGENLRTMEGLTGDIVPPERSCPTWQGLYTGLRQLRRDLMDDLHLENNVLFARAETRAKTASAEK